MSNTTPNAVPPGVPDDALPAWAAALLRQPAPADADAAARARTRVMAQVRHLPRHRHRAAYRLAAAAPRWARRRGAAAGALLAAAALTVVAGARLGPCRLPGDAISTALDAALGTPLAATVLRDTVLRGAALGGALGGTLGSSTLGDAVRDTLRVVRFAFAGPTAARVALAADFTGWRPAAPLARDARSGAWTVTLVVPRDVVRYAFVVDGGRGRYQVPAPALPAAGRARAATAGDST